MAVYVKSDKLLLIDQKLAANPECCCSHCYHKTNFRIIVSVGDTVSHCNPGSPGSCSIPPQILGPFETYEAASEGLANFTSEVANALNCTILETQTIEFEIGRAHV